MPAIKDTNLFCCYCGQKFSIHVRMTSDHLIPLSKGGKNSAYNKRNCCTNCNQNKGSMFPEKFLLHIYKRLYKLNKTALQNISNKQYIKSRIYEHEILVENIKYILEYVHSAGEKLFIDKYFYESYLEERSFVQELLKNFDRKQAA